MAITFGSLFAGIGGLDLGLERAGMECRWQVEIDDYAQRVLAKHWPDVRRHDDIRTWPQPGAERVDLICGGFPCQDISYAGQGAGLSGERSGLFYELIRVVREMEPRYVLLENVAALLTRGLDDVLGTLASLGYDAEWHCIPAAAVGAPHFRNRVFLIAYAAHVEHPVCPRFQGLYDARRGVSVQSIAEDVARNVWHSTPRVCGRNPRVPARVDRLRGLGNAVVPQVAEWIGRRIMESDCNQA